MFKEQLPPFLGGQEHFPTPPVQNQLAAMWLRMNLKRGIRAANARPHTPLIGTLPRKLI